MRKKHSGTDYIMLNTGKCNACWKCIEACPKNVFGKIDILVHRHAKIMNSANCTGCFKCLDCCDLSAISVNK